MIRRGNSIGNLFLVGVLSFTLSGSIDSTGLTGLDEAAPPHEQSPSSWVVNQNITIECSQLRPGQYYCEDPRIDEKTQQPINCSKETRTSKVRCYPVPGIICSGEEQTGSSIGFYKHVPCKWTNGHSFSVAVLLSVFLGMFGVDRFYLGYPAIGLLKLCTLGFMFLGQLVDILLIALQVVGPSDGSDYVIDYYGPGLTYVGRDNFTFIQPHY